MRVSLEAPRPGPGSSIGLTRDGVADQLVAAAALRPRLFLISWERPGPVVAHAADAVGRSVLHSKWGLMLCAAAVGSPGGGRTQTLLQRGNGPVQTAHTNKKASGKWAPFAHGKRTLRPARKASSLPRGGSADAAGMAARVRWCWCRRLDGTAAPARVGATTTAFPDDDPTAAYAGPDAQLAAISGH